MFIIDKQLNIRGVYVPAYNNRYYEFVAQMSQWIREVRSLSIANNSLVNFSHLPAPHTGHWKS